MHMAELRVREAQANLQGVRKILLRGQPYTELEMEEVLIYLDMADRAVQMLGVLHESVSDVQPVSGDTPGGAFA